MNELQKIESFQKELALAETFEQIKLLGDAGEAYQAFMIKQGIGKDGINKLGKFLIEVDVKKGEWLNVNYPRKGTGANQYQSAELPNDKLSTMPATPKESARARTLSRTSDEVMQSVISELEESDEFVLPNTVYKEIKNLERKKEIEVQKEKLNSEALEKPEGLFDVICIDPPWAYGREYDPETSRVANPYPEMSNEEIKDIELPANENAVIFLWTTHQFLPHAFDIAKHWGFDYKATLVWNKEKIGMGAWFRMQCEFCLVLIKGNPFWQNTTERDIIIEARRQHSRKPEAFFEMVNKICVGRKLEYFAREKRDGWDSFGTMEFEKK